MAGNGPKNQHYVWQHYLRAWAHGGQVWCVRAPKKQAFCPNTSNIGSETYFYRIQELDEHDIAYLQAVISRATSVELRKLNEGWIELFQMTFAVRTAIADHGADASIVAQLLSKLEDIEKTIGERYHTGVEEKAFPILQLLRAGNAAFYEEADGASDFIHFLTLQYFRTARMRNAATRIPLTAPWNPHRTWPIESFIYATNVGASLFAERKRYAISFLRNDSPVPFIASDQPMINLNRQTDPDLCLFYPVSPTMAVMYSADRERFPLGISPVGEVGAQVYNYLLYAKSDSQIYGVDRAYLEEMATLPKDGMLG